MSDAERSSVHQYLTENPEELESVMMMDEDYELELDEAEENDLESIDTSRIIPFHDIALCAAAFVPQSNSHVKSSTNRIGCDFTANLDQLVDELEFK